LTAVIVEAVRPAILQLRSEHPESFCVYALVTVGEGLRPYLAATVHGDGRWDLADSPYAVVCDEWLAQTQPAFDERGTIDELTPQEWDAELATRLASMEAALRAIDAEGLVGRGVDRDKALLLVALMPPDESDAGFARRLNPPGPLLEAWLAEAAEGR
jgi:hypothetical protein